MMSHVPDHVIGSHDHMVLKLLVCSWAILGFLEARASLATVALVILWIGMMVFALVVTLPPYTYPFPFPLVLWQRIWVTLHYLHHMMPSPWC